MESFISNVIPPYPDELLHSWVIRLAKINSMSPRLFYQTYFQKKINPYKDIPADIRDGFLAFYNSLQCDVAPHKLYFGLTTMSLDLSALTQSKQTEIGVDFFNNDTTHFGNFVRTFKTFNTCCECIKEDIEEYGEMYLHRSHHIFGVKVCHKHHYPLEIIKNASIGVYGLSMGAHELHRSFEQECEYAEFAHCLLKYRFQSNIDDIVSLLYQKTLQNSEKDKTFLAEKCFCNVSNTHVPTYKRKTDEEPFNTNEIIFLLQSYYKDPIDVMNKIKPHKILKANKCEICGRYYYVNNFNLEENTGCPHCNHSI